MFNESLKYFRECGYREPEKLARIHEAMCQSGIQVNLEDLSESSYRGHPALRSGDHIYTVDQWTGKLYTILEVTWNWG